MFKKTITKDQHIDNFRQIRNYIEKAYPEYEIEIEETQFFFDATLRLVLKGKYK